MVSVRTPICAPCRQASADPMAVSKVLTDLQQYRCVVNHRFADTKGFVERLRAAAIAAGFRKVEGPAAVEIVGQRAVFDRGPLGAYNFVTSVLHSISIGEHTDVQAMHVALTSRGKMFSEVAIRGMLEDELDGIGGVTRW